MDWIQALSLFAANAGLIFWFRAESRSDTRMMLGVINSIKDEMKDFHGRLCAIEEKNRRGRRR
jgi:hypothetical protein